VIVQHKAYQSGVVPVDYVNDPRVIAEEDCFVSINATTEVDLVGQCAPSRIRTTLTPGSMVTTLKNTVDHIVTEYGVADMRGRSISERAAALIRSAHPRFLDELGAEARALGYL
jgi:acyl-CoA hydrolase